MFDASLGVEVMDSWEKEEERVRLRTQMLQDEMEKIEKEESQPLANFFRFFARIVIRSLRIIIGIGVAAIGVWAGFTAYESLSDPIASQSVVDIVGGLFYAFIAFASIRASFSVAFGRGPSSDDEMERRQRKAVDRLKGNHAWKILWK